jgi:hypothetical protein
MLKVTGEELRQEKKRRSRKAKAQAEREGKEALAILKQMEQQEADCGRKAMKISVGKPLADDTVINVHFGRRAEFQLEDAEAEKLKGQLAAYFAGEVSGEPDEVYVIDSTYAEDHLQILVGDVWFEITVEEVTDFVAKLDDFV